MSMTIKTPPTTLDVKKDNISKYEGETKDDGTPHGQGTYTYSHGDKYVGEYQDGEIHGQGTYFWADGEKYIGEFKNDLKHVPELSTLSRYGAIHIVPM